MIRRRTPWCRCLGSPASSGVSHEPGPPLPRSVRRHPDRPTGSAPRRPGSDEPVTTAMAFNVPPKGPADMMVSSGRLAVPWPVLGARFARRRCCEWHSTALTVMNSAAICRLVHPLAASLATRCSLGVSRVLLSVTGGGNRQDDRVSPSPHLIPPTRGLAWHTRAVHVNTRWASGRAADSAGFTSTTNEGRSARVNRKSGTCRCSTSSCRPYGQGDDGRRRGRPRPSRRENPQGL